MENKKLFPLQRNKYFFGKLLTQRDMEAEQNYLNNKRRLLNALIHGSGVVCGMSVVKVDGVTVAVESGFALDGLGRELAMDKPVIKPLFEIEGFDGDMGIAKHVYLCAEYAETLCEPMHALTDGTLDENRFGRIEEGVRLYLRYDGSEDIGPNGTDTLEHILERGERARLYLAKIHLTRWGDAYEIDAVEPLPFNQKISLPSAKETSSSTLDITPPEQPFATARTFLEDSRPIHAFGTAPVMIPEGARAGSLHFSEDIVHGLGLSSVYITLGLQTGDGAIFGAPSIFQPRDYEWAAQTSGTNGSFRIGVRLRNEQTDKALSFLWKAEVIPGQPAEPASPKIMITPGSIRLTFRQSVQFTAAALGLPASDIVWFMREQDSGGITKDGYYVAPNTEGVFTVCAASASKPGTEGTAYVIVRQA
jgi:hypothetical protein